MRTRLLFILLSLSLALNLILLIPFPVFERAADVDTSVTPQEEMPLSPPCPAAPLKPGKRPAIGSRPDTGPLLPPPLELEQAISEWTRGSEGSQLLARLFVAEQGRSLPALFSQLSISPALQPQISELLEELYRLSFEQPANYGQRSKAIWEEIAMLTDPQTQGRLERTLGSDDPYRMRELQGRMAEQGELLSAPQRDALQRMMVDAEQQLTQNLATDPELWLEAQRQATQQLLAQTASLLNAHQYQVLRDMLELDLLHQEVSTRLEQIYQDLDPQPES
ncbi:hypothetical protein [Aeromonas simiae]|uniref:hypothetical protein n=2 Tax=Aeromonas simiae TaxID=218936 RepID=UPI00266B9348|nr:hypothetical protein [Aeromonas simiae]MDO2949192.1 hypothetical protein [Aeromonas simiae]MDO2951174.1 hypothetical protein [Aeromonas simiae]MDO2956410.1 hypothetical protein [Aeromonas simiae]